MKTIAIISLASLIALTGCDKQRSFIKIKSMDDEIVRLYVGLANKDAKDDEKRKEWFSKADEKAENICALRFNKKANLVEERDRGKYRTYICSDY